MIGLLVGEEYLPTIEELRLSSINASSLCSVATISTKPSFLGLSVLILNSFLFQLNLLKLKAKSSPAKSK